MTDNTDFIELVQNNYYLNENNYKEQQQQYIMIKLLKVKERIVKAQES